MISLLLKNGLTRHRNGLFESKQKYFLRQMDRDMQKLYGMEIDLFDIKAMLRTELREEENHGKSNQTTT